MNKYLRRCEELLQKSNCKLIHFGAILVKDNKIIGEGYNYSLDPEKCCLKDLIENKEVGKNPGICNAIHSEWMTIIDAFKRGYDPVNSTIYIVGKYPDGTIFKTGEKLFACTICSRLLKYCGIKYLVELCRDNSCLEVDIDYVYRTSFKYMLGEKYK